MAGGQLVYPQSGGLDKRLAVKAGFQRSPLVAGAVGRLWDGGLVWDLEENRE